MLKHHIFLFLLLISINVNAFVQEIGPGLFVHIGKHLDIDEGYDGDICNIGFIVGEESIAVIDSGGSYLVANELLKYISVNFKQPIKYVINTHAHLDHVYGNIVFTDADIYGHKDLPKALKSRADIYQRINERYLGKISERSPLILPNKFVEINKPELIDLGNRKIKLQAYQVAHTESDLTVFDEKTQILWSGDLVFSERTPVVDGDIHGFIETLEEMNKQDIDLVIPGHGLPSSKKYAIQPMLEYLITLRDDIRQFIDNGESLEYAIENAANNQKDLWLLFDVQNKRNVNRIFPMMEWE